MMRAKLRLFVLTMIAVGTFSSLVSPAARSADCPPGFFLAANQALVAQNISTGSAGGAPSAGKDKDSKGFIDLPKQPTAPPRIGSSSEVVPIGCDRAFRVGGRVKPLDSHHRQDAENLRPFLEGVPQAMAELNEYQRNKRKARFARYTGTLGLAAALATFLFVDRPAKNEPKLLYNLGLYGGLGLLGTSVGYSMAVTQTNEEHISRAVDIHNRERPERKIELLFRTGF